MMYGSRPNLRKNFTLSCVLRERLEHLLPRVSHPFPIPINQRVS